MAVSVRMDPLLEKELELASKRRGITKSQFIVEAVQKALGRPDAHALMMKLKAEEEAEWAANGQALPSAEGPYDTHASREAVLRKLRAKHGLSSAG